MEIFKDKSTQNSLNSTNSQTQNSPEISTQNNKKSSSHKKWGFVLFPFFVLILALGYGGYIKLFATDFPYNPGTTIDPNCDPTTPNCTVSVYPTMASTTAGKFLSNDGVNTIWTDPSGFFNGAQTNYRSGLPVPVGDTLVASSTTLAQFIQNYFFPAPALSVSVVGSNPTSLYYGQSYTEPLALSNYFSVKEGSSTTLSFTSGCLIAASSTFSNTPSGFSFGDALTSFAAGTYKVNYSAHEGSGAGCNSPGQSGTATRNITVNEWTQPTVSLTSSASGTYEWGTTPNFTLNYNVTKRYISNNVTAIDLKSDNGGTSALCSGGSCPVTDISGGGTGDLSLGINMSTIGSNTTGTPISQTGSRTVTAVAGSSTTFYMTVTSARNTAVTSASISYSFQPKIYYGMYLGNDPLMSMADNAFLWNDIKSLPNSTFVSAATNSPAVALNTYTNTSGLDGKFFYIAFPSYHYPSSAFSLEGDAPYVVASSAVTDEQNATTDTNGCTANSGDGMLLSNGTKDCFHTVSGGSTTTYVPFWHRTVLNFTNGQGIVMPYELYRLPNGISNGASVGVQVLRSY